MRPIIAAAALAALSAPAGASELYSQVKVQAGEALFKAECRRCHAPDLTHDSYGPTLENVIGRAAGSVPDYD